MLTGMKTAINTIVEVSSAMATLCMASVEDKIRRAVATVKVGLHGLHHDDGIIDHSTDGEHKGKERQQIETEAHKLYEGKGTDERHHDAHRGNERGTKVLQEHPYHEDDKQDGLEERLQHGVDGSVEIEFGIVDLLEMDALGQVIAHLLDGGIDLVDDGRGVAAIEAFMVAG